MKLRQLKNFVLVLTVFGLPDLAGGESLPPPARLFPAADARFIWINIPSAELQFWDHNQLLIKMPVLIGKKNSPTPVLTTNLTSIDVRPDWIIPSLIVENETLPHWRRDPHYLEHNQIEIVDLDNGVHRFVQKSGDHNPLGLVRFNLRPYSSIYLHDTPRKDLFNKSNRLVSHGCVRLKDAGGLLLALSIAGLLPADTTLEKLAAENREIHFDLTIPVPVYLTYFTRWLDGQNNFNQAPDVYDWASKQGETP